MTKHVDRVRALQDRTGWPYTKVLSCFKHMSADAIETLVRINCKPSEDHCRCDKSLPFDNRCMKCGGRVKA